MRDYLIETFKAGEYRFRVYEVAEPKEPFVPLFRVEVRLPKRTQWKKFVATYQTEKGAIAMAFRFLCARLEGLEDDWKFPFK